MKGDKEHRVPLPERVLEILAELPRAGIVAPASAEAPEAAQRMADETGLPKLPSQR